MKGLAQMLRDRKGVVDDHALTVCDSCGTPTKAGAFGVRLASANGGKPPAHCVGCYTERREKQERLAQHMAQADEKLWKVFRAEWNRTNEDDREALRLTFVSKTYDRPLFEELSKDWVRLQTTKRDRKRVSGSDRDAGF